VSKKKASEQAYTEEELSLSPKEFNKRCKPIVDDAMRELAEAVICEARRIDVNS
jgi:hypothetical protein